MNSTDMLYGWPRPDGDPRERAARRREQNRIERIETFLSPLYDPARFVGKK